MTLELPKELEVLVRSDRWPSDPDVVRLQNLKAQIPVERIRALAPEKDT